MANDKIKRVQLNIEEELNFSAYGIVSSEPDYKISLLLNNLLGISLRSAGSVEYEVSEGKNVNFSRFNDLTRLPSSWISVVSNRSDNYPLIRKFPNIDFIVLQFDELIPEGDSILVNLLKSSGFISAVFIIDKSSLDKTLTDCLLPWH
jgi:hypothetical protein